MRRFYEIGAFLLVPIKISDEAMELICAEAAAEKMGARPLKRLIQSKIEDQIVNYYFKNEQLSGPRFNFQVKNNDIKFDVN